MRSEGLKSAREVVSAGLAPPAQLTDLEQVAARYAVAVTPDIAALIDPADPNDPIARQFVPDVRELDTRPASAPTPSATGRRAGRGPRAPLSRPRAAEARQRLRGLLPVLLPPRDGRPGRRRRSRRRALTAALAYIHAHPEIWEVILTGGDPLVLSPRRLGDVMRALAAIEHVKIVRMHTRAAGRRTRSGSRPPLVRALKAQGKATYVALHANHPRELTPRGARRLRAARSTPASRC